MTCFRDNYTSDGMVGSISRGILYHTKTCLCSISVFTVTGSSTEEQVNALRNCSKDAAEAAQEVYFMATLKDIVRGRRSVRTFDGNPVSPEDREKLGEYINAGITNPFGIPAEFVLLAAEEYGLLCCGKGREGSLCGCGFWLFL